MTNINFNQFEDEFGNVIQEFEVIKYEKYADGEWVEVERRESGRTYFNVDGKLYYRTGNSSFPLNMDFNSSTCGACFVIGENIYGKKKITSNLELFTIKYPKSTLTLHKQTYSDNTCFYSLQEPNGSFKVNYGSRDINDLISQLQHENKVYSSNIQDCNEEIILNIVHANNEMINYMKGVHSIAS
ncbi:hypothetical protein [Lysinibacillus sp. NPDC086135]|uniref:hypothetical protein n=1 Tax=Lysinibacillus sp. NPDC086135 TaxID=3364130 RepID=UPI00381A1986